MRIKLDDLWLCSDCMTVTETGDYSGFDYYYTDEKERDARIAEVNKGIEALGPHLVSDFADGEGEEEFSRRSCDACGTPLAGARFRFAVLEDEPEEAATIRQGMARAFFASAWADLQDEIGGRIPPGIDIMDAMPTDTDPAALHAADTLWSDWTRKLGVDPLAYWQTRIPAEIEISAEDFGHYAAMEAMGHGVGLFDYGIDVDVPTVEFGSYSLTRDYPRA